MMRLLPFVFFQILFTINAADVYVGVWDNKRQSFQQFSFVLRKDGRGYYASSMSKGILCWQPTDTGIDIQLADGKNGKNKMRFIYDSKEKTLVLDQNNRKMTMWKVSSKEPSDLDAKLIKQRLHRKKEHQKNIPTSTERKETFFSKKELTKRLHYWMNYVPPKGWATISIRLGDSICPFGFQLVGGSTTFMIQTIDMKDSAKSSDIIYGYSVLKERPDLPINKELPKPKFELLKKWLNEQKIIYHITCKTGRDLWRVLSYSESLRIIIKPDKNQNLQKVTQYIIDKIYDNAKPPFSIIVYEPKEN